jgi:hypothetical protein
LSLIRKEVNSERDWLAMSSVLSPANQEVSFFTVRANKFAWWLKQALTDINGFRKYNATSKIILTFNVTSLTW